MQQRGIVTRETHFEKGPIVRTLLYFTAPILLSQLLQQVYNITDCIIVGRFCGEYGLAATGICGLILSVITNFFIGFSSGVGVMTSHLFGAYDYSELKKTISTVVNLGIITGIVLTTLGLFLSERFLIYINCPAEMLDIANRYLSICFLGLAPQLVYNIGNAILRSLGDTKTSLYYLILSCGINLLLDCVFVLGFKLSLEGAAIATVVAHWILFALILRRLTRLSSDYAYHFKSEFLPLKDLLKLFTLSIPSGMQALFMSISSLVLQVSINSFGPAAAAGMTVYAKIEGFLYYPAFSYGIALTDFVGQNYGANCIERIKKSVHLSLIVSTAIILPLSLLLIWISPSAIRIFTTDEAILFNGFQAILWNFPAYFLYMINQIYLGALKGLGKTSYPMICTMVCYCFFRVAWCHFLIPVFNSMIVVYTSYDASWVIMLLMLLPVYKLSI